MENIDKKENIPEKGIHKSRVHSILAKSYFATFFLFLIGFLFDSIFEFKFFEHISFVYVGFLLIILATLLIFWAQKSSRDFKNGEITKETFLGGPYKFTRSPTHYGLLFLVMGFGITINAAFVVLSAVLSFLISKFYFLKKEEKILTEKYGAPYMEYKKTVRF